MHSDAPRLFAAETSLRAEADAMLAASGIGVILADAGYVVVRGAGAMTPARKPGAPTALRPYCPSRCFGSSSGRSARSGGASALELPKQVARPAGSVASCLPRLRRTSPSGFPAENREHVAHEVTPT